MCYNVSCDSFSQMSMAVTEEKEKEEEEEEEKEGKERGRKREKEEEEERGRREEGGRRRGRGEGRRKEKRGKRRRRRRRGRRPKIKRLGVDGLSHSFRAFHPHSFVLITLVPGGAKTEQNCTSPKIPGYSREWTGPGSLDPLLQSIPQAN